MIAVTPQSNQLYDQNSGPVALPRWQQAMAQSITDPAELLAVLNLPLSLLPRAKDAAKRFPLRVPRNFVARMQRGNPYDPLLMQVLPITQELDQTAGFSSDPVGDMASKIASGVLHKYEGRALLIATGACGIHCRYCFRRHFPYGEENAASHHWKHALDVLRADDSIREVILSGGDPLTLNDRRLREFTEGLQSLPHVTRLRIHTRQPVVLPERVDGELLAWLMAIPLQKVMVLHANHAQEIDDNVRAACRSLAGTGTTLLNQSVLLKGINDSTTILAELSETLFEAGVMPYYLHLLDRVHGAAHFEVDEHRAGVLMRELLTQLPGYLVPRLVREIPGDASKTPVPL